MCAGINIFLDGFVPSENLRFRETALVFKLAETAQEEIAKRTFKREFPSMVKRLGILYMYMYTTDTLCSLSRLRYVLVHEARQVLADATELDHEYTTYYIELDRIRLYACRRL